MGNNHSWPALRRSSGWGRSFVLKKIRSENGEIDVFGKKRQCTLQSFGIFSYPDPVLPNMPKPMKKEKSLGCVGLYCPTLTYSMYIPPIMNALTPV